MKKSLVYVLLIGLLSLIGTADLAAQKMKLDRWVFGSGGVVNAKSAENWQLSGIVGQLAIEKRTGTIDGKNVNLYQGFWVPMEEITDVENPNQLSSDLVNFPNPVSNSTTFRYSVPGTSYVTLKVYDVVGHVVKVLFDGYQDAGLQEITWNAKDETGMDLSSGSYLYELNVRPAQLAGQPGYQSFTLRNVLVIVR